jgi:hypothetical protein
VSTSTSIQALAGSSGGGLPSPRIRSASVTVTTRDGDQVTVSTWDVCQGVADFVASLLGEPGEHVTANGDPS